MGKKHRNCNRVSSNPKSKKRIAGEEDLEGISKTTKSRTAFKVMTTAKEVPLKLSVPCGVPCGIQNVGNSCFFNSVMQSLRACIAVNEIHTPHGEIATLLVDVLGQLGVGGRVSVNPTLLFQRIGQSFKQFKSRRQQDAHELYTCLFSQLDEDINKATKDPLILKSSDNLAANFSCKMVSMVTCEQCKTKTARLDSCYAVSVGIPGSESLNKYPIFKPRTLKLFKKDLTLKAVPESETIIPSSSAQMMEDGVSVSGNETVQLTATTETTTTITTTTTPTTTVAAADLTVSSIGDITELTNQMKTLMKTPSAEEEANCSGSNGSSDFQEAIESEGKSTENSSHSENETIDANVELAKTILEPPLPLLDTATPLQLKLENCLQLFTNSEKLLVSEGNGFECNVCCKSNDEKQETGTGYGTGLPNIDECKDRRVNATKRVMLFEPPKILAIHLKRLLPGGKQTALVRLPLTLNLSSYTAVPTETSPSELKENGTTKAIVDQSESALTLSSTTIVIEPKDAGDRVSTATGFTRMTLRSHVARNVESDHATNNLDKTSSDPSDDVSDSDDNDVNDVNDNKYQDANNASAKIKDDNSNKTSNNSNCNGSIGRRIHYDLRGVIVHQGGPLGGHYVAYISLPINDSETGSTAIAARERQWFLTSDTKVRLATVDEVLSSQAYMAFYQAHEETSC